ncbi:hypothetical protein AGMMS50239_05880 [Bacteroidia bacterium]|nr:hypothetical protein FACS189426_12760 [Bacteroidia bacterium]GHT59379.1 hypothetical protein AGMMS50239_05880 [Bacteroidia bacterium]
MQKYIVWVDDNYHFMDKEYRSKAGEYDTEEEAIAKCREIVESFFPASNESCKTAEELFSGWSMFGEDPFIENGGFSASGYAKELCEKLSAKNAKPQKINAVEYVKNIWKKICQH